MTRGTRWSSGVSKRRETPHVDVNGSGGVRDFCAGFTFKLKDYEPDSSLDKKYLLATVQHTVTQDPEYDSGASVRQSVRELLRVPVCRCQVSSAT